VEVEAMNEGHTDKSMATHAILKFKSILEHETVIIMLSKYLMAFK
jgi:hypothetical protein